MLDQKFSEEVVRAFIENDGEHCPYCGGINIDVTDRDMPWISIRCGDCKKTWDEVYQLVGINDQFLPPKQTPVIIEVSGGCVQSVKGIDGKEYICQSIIDYDNQSNGGCPICGIELEEMPCPDCGFDEKLDNAFELAVTMAQGRDENS